MQKVTFVIPGMWADHHVLAVRDVLRGLPGVSNVYASAMDKEVSLELDAQAASPEAVAKALVAGGYAPGVLPESGPAPRNKVSWATCGYRVTCSNLADQPMSGESRKH
jgi:copper chaperone CopZ